MSQLNSTHDKSGWSANLYNKNASFVYSAAFTSPVLTLLNAKAGERIIDFGCGSGELTKELETIVEGEVVGVDASQSMIEKAQANGLKNAFVADLQAFEFPKGYAGPKVFDAVFSNATLHWCKRDPAAVIKAAKSVLKDGGRFVGEMGGMHNCIGIRSALHAIVHKHGYDPNTLDPWFFPSVETYRQFLESESFIVNECTLTARITPLPEGLSGWLQTFVRGTFLKTIGDQEAQEILEEVESMCRVDCRDESGNWSMMYTRLRFSAILA